MTNRHSDITNHPGNYQPNQEDDEIDLGELIATILDGKHLIAIITLVFLTLGVAKALLDTPIYKADAMLQVEEKLNSLGDLASVSSLVGGQEEASAEIEIIKSRKVLGEAVKNLNLDIIAKPKYFPIIGAAIARRFQKQNITDQVSAPLFGLDQYAWGGEAIRIDTFSTPESWVDKGINIDCRRTRSLYLSG